MGKGQMCRRGSRRRGRDMLRTRRIGQVSCSRWGMAERMIVAFGWKRNGQTGIAKATRKTGARNTLTHVPFWGGGERDSSTSTRTHEFKLFWKSREEEFSLRPVRVRGGAWRSNGCGCVDLIDIGGCTGQKNGRERKDVDSGRERKGKSQKGE